MSEFLASLAQIAVLLFAVSSMASVGLSHNFREIFYPLRNMAGVTRALVANFVLVPLLGLAVARLVGLTPPHEAGLMLIAMAAGAPFLLKLTERAEHDVGLSATVLVLLLPATVVYMPLFVPLALPDARVNAAAIAMPLVLTMLLPLAIGLTIHERFSIVAARVQPTMGTISSFMLVLLVTATLLANFERVLAMFGTGAILAAMFLIGGAFLIGYALGGQDPENRPVLALATAQRNIAAATVVATQGFADLETLVMVITSSLVGLAMLFAFARLLRQRAAKRRVGDGGKQRGQTFS